MADDLGAEVGEEPGHERRDLLDPGRGIAAAVDVHEALEIGEVGRARRRGRGLDGRQLVGRDAGAGRGDRLHSASLRGPPLAILAGSCARSRSDSSRVRTSTGSSRWSKSRWRSAGGGPGTANGRPAATPSSGSRAVIPRRGWPGQIEGVVDWARRLRAEHGEGRGGVVVHRSSDPGHWIVTFPWTGAERAHTIAEAALALAERDVSPARRARLTGAQERILARWQARIAEARATPPTWIRDADRRDPRRLDHRNQRQEHGHPAHHPHPRQGRPPGRHDDVRRRARQRAARRSGRLDGARRGAPDPRPVRPRRRGPRDRTRRARPPRHGLRVERGQRRHERDVGPSRSPGHPHAARARRGQVDRRPGHETGRLGGPQRRRPARRRDRPPGPEPRRAVLARAGWLGGASGGTSRPAAAATWSATAGSSSSTPKARVADRRARPRSRSRSAGIARHNVANALAAAAAARGLGATLAEVADGPRRLPPDVRSVARPAEPVPARGADRHRRLRPQRGGRRARCSTSPRGSPAAPPAAPRRSPRSSGTAGDRPDDTLRGIARIAGAAGPAGRDQGDAEVPPRPVARVDRRRAAGRRPRGRPRTSRRPGLRDRRRRRSAASWPTAAGPGRGSSSSCATRSARRCSRSSTSSAPGRSTSPPS